MLSAIVLTPLNHFRASSLQLPVSSSGSWSWTTLRREPRFRTSKIATYSAAIVLPTRALNCWFVAKGCSVKTIAQLRLLGAVQLPLLVTARRDWVPTCTFCARDHRLNCWNGKLMLLGDCNIPGDHAHHACRRARYRVAVEVAAVRSGAWFHSSILGYLKVGKKRQISFCEQKKESKQE